ncbi:nucleoid-associated protein [Vibrio splendidus]
MAVLNDNVIESLQIENFIYHIIRNSEDEATLNDEVTLEAEQKLFFERQIRRACEGTQFKFSATDSNTCRNDCIAILDSVSNLAPKSGELANRFFSAHNNTMSDGIFIVATISVMVSGERSRLLSFLKIDFTTVYQQNRTEIEGRNVVSLTRIIDSLADTPTAIQKWALIDPSPLFDWDVIALQRGKTSKFKDTNESISDYFRSFLHVTVRENASSLTKKTVSETTGWSQTIALDGGLPGHVSRTDLKARAISYFELNNSFDSDDFATHVVGSFIPPELREDDLTEEQRVTKSELVQKQAACKESLTSMLTEKEIAGQIFECRPNSISSGDKRSKMKTDENVTILFEGEMSDNNIVIIRGDDGSATITINTSNYTVD